MLYFKTSDKYDVGGLYEYERKTKEKLDGYRERR